MVFSTEVQYLEKKAPITNYALIPDIAEVEFLPQKHPANNLTLGGTSPPGNDSAILPTPLGIKSRLRRGAFVNRDAQRDDTASFFDIVSIFMFTIAASGNYTL